MALIERIPVNPNSVRVRYPVVRFSAPFFAGQYDFGQAGNTGQLVLAMQANSVYCLERINFFAQVSESAWLESMDTAANFPAFALQYEKDSNTPIFPEPVRCVNYIDNAEQLVFFRSTRESERLMISFSGVVNQAADMVGIDPLLAQVNFTLYQVTDDSWNDRFIDGKNIARGIL
jgi:hypothetical protein